MDHSLPAIKNIRLPWGILALVAAGMGGLYVFFPYFGGYSGQRGTIVFWLLYQYFNYGQGDWEHCLAVPLISAALAYRLRERLVALPARPSQSGLWLLFFSLFSYWFGYVADVEYFGYLSLYLSVAGLILWFRGRETMKILFFPWLFLGFMFPLPFLDNLLAFPLRMLMSQTAHLLLAILGIANTRIGTAIVSSADPAHGLAQGSRFAIDIADPCSGIHSLFALLMISALYGYFSLPPGWRRGTLFLMAIPLAVAGNVVRIVMLAFGTLLFGAPFAIGAPEQPTWFHMGAGYVVFAVALAGMMGAAWCLIRIDTAAIRARPAGSSPPASSLRTGGETY